MRTLYTYELSTVSHDGRWVVRIRRQHLFSRSPEDIARSILEQWINDHRGQLPGGRVFTFRCPSTEPPVHVLATVRVLVFRGGLDSHSPRPGAAAYLGDELS